MYAESKFGSTMVLNLVEVLHQAEEVPSVPDVPGTSTKFSTMIHGASR
jgi:hypothetical protein